MIKFFIHTAPCQQFFMGTGFRNPIFCQNQNFLCILDRCQTVGDHKCRTVLCQFLQ